jgi:hypothetical protein
MMSVVTPSHPHPPQSPPHRHNNSAAQPTPLDPLNLWTLAGQQLLQQYLHPLLLLLLACQTLLLLQLLLLGQLVCVLAAPAALQLLPIQTLSYWAAQTQMTVMAAAALSCFWCCCLRKDLNLLQRSSAAVAAAVNLCCCYCL